MTITEPKIDKLLEQTEDDSFLLCGVVAKRARLTVDLSSSALLCKLCR